MKAVTLNQEWIESSDDKTGWISLGWFTESGEPIDIQPYEMVTILDTNKYGNITKAIFIQESHKEMLLDFLFFLYENNLISDCDFSYEEEVANFLTYPNNSL